MATHVRKEFGNENAVPGPKPILKKTNQTYTVCPSKAVNKTKEPTLIPRGPLGELGNKQLNLKPSINIEPSNKKINATIGTLKDNLPVVRKINSAKENVTKSDQMCKPKQTTNKPILKRQESVLSKLVKPLSNINVKEVKDKSSNAVLNKAVVPAANSYSSKQLVDIIDVDESDKALHSVSIYIKDIMRYLLELEKRYAIAEKYLLLQKDGQKHETSPKMRSVLINWMVEVHGSFSFLPETLHLSVAVTDRYLQKMPNVGRKTLQMVGIIALYVAGKYEEMYIPEISEFVFMCDDVFSKHEMFQMEKDILNRLGFQMGGPLSLHFLRRYNKIAGVEVDHHILGKYLLELALIDHRVSHILPSLQAAAACFLAIATLGTNLSSNSKLGTQVSACSPSIKIAQYWTSTLAYYTTYSFATITPYVHNLALLLSEAPNSKYQAVRSKYASSEHRKISTLAALQSPIVKKLASLAKI